MIIKHSPAFFFAIGLPVFLGFFFLKLDDSEFAFSAPAAIEPSVAPTETNAAISKICKERFEVIFRSVKDPFENVSIVLHANGDPERCGETGSGSRFHSLLLQNYAAVDNVCPPELSKFHVESLLTKTFSQLISTCVDEDKRRKSKGFLGFCDAGEKRTPILLDHDDLVPVKSDLMKTSLPCRFHTREGLRISYMDQLTGLAASKGPAFDCETAVDGDVVVEDAATQTCKVIEQDGPPSEVHLYAVPAGRVFMFAPDHVGEIFLLSHVEGAGNLPIYLEVLSLTPRVFDVFNFFSRDESQELVDKAIAESSDSHRIKRSSTGASGYNVNSRRTSESGFDTHGKTSTIVKRRCFSALGFDDYLESHGDGLQILRYNVSTAYNSHLDWIGDSDELPHDYRSAGTGGNRFATILMYMSDMGPEDGGETVFPFGWPPDVRENERLDQKTALRELRKSGSVDGVLKRSSWEESLVATCRSRLAIRPHTSRAVLFYSQHPGGAVDHASLHGACPVLSGTKYAANLWVWNTPRQGFPGAPVKEKFREEYGERTGGGRFLEIKASFENSGTDERMRNAKLLYEDEFWGDIGFGDPTLNVNTYEGHIWNVSVDGKVVKTFEIVEKRGPTQVFAI